MLDKALDILPTRPLAGMVLFALKSSSSAASKTEQKGDWRRKEREESGGEEGVGRRISTELQVVISNGSFPFNGVSAKFSTDFDRSRNNQE